MSFLVWYLWLDLLGDRLYEFDGLLFRASPEASLAFNRGFDREERFFNACSDLAYWDDL